MERQIQNLLEKAYGAFNSRNIAEALSTMHTEIKWPKAFEGGYVTGHDQITAYWTRQWSEINPIVKPTGIKRRDNGAIEVTVNQNVKDLSGHTYLTGL